jgi:glycosyltransferase involved in cell wall biosynthesis
MRISIVVPAYNEARGLPATLASIRRATAAFDARGWAHEIIVCDNNSTDGTAEIAREAGATVVFEPVNQISRARNAGATRAGGDWLVFVDADSHPSPELFADAADAIATGVCLAGGATVALDRGTPLGRGVVLIWNLVSRVRRLAAGSFIFCEARAFREAGGFSLELYATEELELFKRLKRLARATGRTIVILHTHPLVTSDRKARLYTKREIAGSLLKSVLTLGRAMRNRDDCYVWYDGRRE